MRRFLDGESRSSSSEEALIRIRSTQTQPSEPSKAVPWVVVCLKRSRKGGIGRASVDSLEGVGTPRK